MAKNCIQLKESNCKNCYKCVRYCPMKSIRVVNGHAEIIPEECILCGRCYVYCPQNAKRLRDDLQIARELISGGGDVYASVAPSYIANYKNLNIEIMRSALKKLGFKDAEETAVGATVVKREYERIITEKNQSVIISSCCHSVNTLIQKQYPDVLPYLAPVLSPMQAHGKLLREKHKNCRVVFIGPCISKKDEVDKYPEYIDCALTFEELNRWMSSEGVEFDYTIKPGGSGGRARWFPTRGGIIESMDLQKDFSYFSVDGVENCLNALEDIRDGNIENCFVEMSACSSSCIGGPVMMHDNVFHVSSCLTIGKTAGETDFDVAQPEDMKKRFDSEYRRRSMPGSAAVDEILRQMGKKTKEQELNCGSCGYPTCREKAVAVINGKADMTMCLPFLKEKAESFSDTIINNTPNGIMVLNDKLEIQQINKSARQIMNIEHLSDVINRPVVDILNPTDYMLAMMNEKNHSREATRKYLKKYNKYIDEIIIYDAEYNIIISIMKDVTYEEIMREQKAEQSKSAVEITDRVVKKQMRVVQEIASLLGETTAETKIALTKLKETLSSDE